MVTWRGTFSTRPCQTSLAAKSRFALSAAAQLPLLINGRSLTRLIHGKIRASTIFPWTRRVAELGGKVFVDKVGFVGYTG